MLDTVFNYQIDDLDNKFFDKNIAGNINDEKSLSE